MRTTFPQLGGSHQVCVVRSLSAKYRASTSRSKAKAKCSDSETLVYIAKLKGQEIGEFLEWGQR